MRLAHPGGSSGSRPATAARTNAAASRTPGGAPERGQPPSHAYESRTDYSGGRVGDGAAATTDGPPDTCGRRAYIVLLDPIPTGILNATIAP